MSDFNSELYDQQKTKYLTMLTDIYKNVDGNSDEDIDAFWNALEDFDNQ